MTFWHNAQMPLVLFTLFTQTAVGAFCVLLVNDFVKRKAPDKVYDAFTRIGTAILVPLTGLGLAFSTFHLGRPVYAFRALRHVETSPLSREVWAFSLFFVLVAAYTYLWWRRSMDAELRRIVGVLTGLAGLVAIYTQAQVYRIPGRPMWNHPSTELLFYTSAFLLGPLVVGVVYSLAWGRAIPMEKGEPVYRTSHKRLGITLLVVAGLEALALLWRSRYLLSALAEPQPIAVLGKAMIGAGTLRTALALAAQTLQGPYGWLLSAQWLLSVALPVVFAIGLWAWHRRGGSLRAAGWAVTAVTLLAITGELAGRSLFYLTGQAWF